MLKVEGNKKDGYTVRKLGRCGLWKTISITYPSRQRADEALARQKDIQLMKQFKRKKKLK